MLRSPARRSQRPVSLAATPLEPTIRSVLLAIGLSISLAICVGFGAGCQSASRTVNDTSGVDSDPPALADDSDVADMNDDDGDAVVEVTTPGIGERPRSSTMPFIRRTSVIGYSTQGRSIECIAIGEGSTHVLVLATIHGDESAGTPLVHRMLDEISIDPTLIDGRTVWVVPVANPDGMSANERGNARGVDLNRNFPADNFVPSAEHGRSPFSEPEAEAIARLIMDTRPRHILSLHQPLNCIDFDGPAGGLALAMAEACELPIRKLGTRPGSLGAYTGEMLEIPTITIELPRKADRMPLGDLWDRYGEMLLVGVAYDGE